MQPFQIATDKTAFDGGAHVLKCTNDAICIDLAMICSINLYTVLK